MDLAGIGRRKMRASFTGKTNLFACILRLIHATRHAIIHATYIFSRLVHATLHAEIHATIHSKFAALFTTLCTAPFMSSGILVAPIAQMNCFAID